MANDLTLTEEEVAAILRLHAKCDNYSYLVKLARALQAAWRERDAYRINAIEEMKMRLAAETECETLLWNLGGCDVIANGGPTDFAEDQARPALFSVRALRERAEAAESRLRAVEAALEAARLRPHQWKGQHHEYRLRGPQLPGCPLCEALAATEETKG